MGNSFSDEERTFIAEEGDSLGYHETGKTTNRARKRSRRRNIICIGIFAALIALLTLHPDAKPSKYISCQLTPTTGESYAATSTGDEPLIPNQVWQLYTSIAKNEANRSHRDAIVKSKLVPTHATSWFPVDGAWTYSFVGMDAGRAFVRKHFPQNPNIIKVFDSFRVPVMASDTLRYLLLAGAGGAYADNDVEMIKPLHEWVPDKYKHVARAMVGIETDMANKDKPNGWHFSFVQHTMMMAKGHPIMTRMAENITNKMLDMAATQNKPLESLELHDLDVVRITGPHGFNTIVFEYLSEQMGSPVDYRNVSRITEPKLFGDTLILPINYFSAGQAHSGSNGSSPDKLSQHYWKGTWRHWSEPL